MANTASSDTASSSAGGHIKRVEKNVDRFGTRKLRLRPWRGWCFRPIEFHLPLEKRAEVDALMAERIEAAQRPEQTHDENLIDKHPE